MQQAPHWEMEEPVGIRLAWRIREGLESQGITWEASSDGNQQGCDGG